jgi:2-polyprenyl-3-methyl-5-hydroxy-6-metoxy-1,4-benzoquinol methylase
MSAIINNLDQVAYQARDTCPLHQSPEPLTGPPIATVSDRFTGRTFDISRCPRCGIGLTHPYPTEATVGKLYEGRSSSQNFDPIRGTFVDRLKDVAATKDLRWIAKFGPDRELKSVLDFGTGNGRFALACARLFPHCHVIAVDFDQQPPPALSMLGGEKVQYQRLEDFKADSGRYDLILLRHVLEHVHDPIGFLRFLACRLTPGGLLYVEVPNQESAYIRLFGTTINAFAAPFHLFHFAAPSLERVINAAGLTLKCQIMQKGMPLTSGTIAELLKQERRLWHQLAGILLHPFQLALDRRYGKPNLVAFCCLNSPGH